jgi:hypothetical protein
MSGSRIGKQRAHGCGTLRLGDVVAPRCESDRASTGYLISHDVPCEQLTFHETKPPRSPLGPI